MKQFLKNSCFSLECDDNDQQLQVRTREHKTESNTKWICNEYSIITLGNKQAAKKDSKEKQRERERGVRESEKIYDDQEDDKKRKKLYARSLTLSIYITYCYVVIHILILKHIFHCKRAYAHTYK